MQLGYDLRYALRRLRRSPGFAITAVLTLALGVGATTAVFSVIDAVLLRPLPFPHAAQIVVPETRSQSGYTQPASLPSYRDERAQLHTFSAFAGFSDFTGLNLESPHGAVALHATKGTDNLFNVLGVQPILGRTFRPGEDLPGRDDVVVLSHEVWQRDFDGDRGVIGHIARLDGKPYTVIGVMPSDFRFPLGQRNAVYTPLHASPMLVNNRGSHWLRTIGRMKPGVSREQAQADLQRVLADLGRAYEQDKGRTVTLISLDATLSEGVASPLTVMGGAVLAVLVLCCVNIAGLLLARGVGREREMAVRAAVGAGRTILLRQVLTESLVLAALGCAAGVLLASGILAAMRAFLTTALDRGAEVHLNLRALAVAVVLAAAASVLAGLLPALRLSGINPSQALRAGGAAGSTRAHHRLRSAFIVTQVALALVLLFTSGLLLRSLSGQRHTDVGFDPTHIASMEVDLSPGRYEGRDAMGNFYQPLLDRIGHAPGVVAAGLINITPIQNWGSNSDVHIKGQPPYPPNQEMLAENRLIDPGYYRVFGIRLVRGRLLDPALDTNPDAPRIVVNQAFVKKFLPAGTDPIGAHLDDANAEIVGVTSNVRHALDRPPLAEMDYIPSELPPVQRQEYLRGMQLVVRTTGDPKALYGTLREAMRQVDPTVPFRTPETMTEIVMDQLNFQQVESWLFGGFAALALLLAVVGIYGLLSHEVERGARDIGVRMALGATRAGVVRVVTARAAAMVALGLAAGALLAVLANRAIAALLPRVYEQHATRNAHLSMAEAGVFLSIAAALFAIGLLASLLPARRAASIEPMTALRME